MSASFCAWTASRRTSTARLTRSSPSPFATASARTFRHDRAISATAFLQFINPFGEATLGPRDVLGIPTAPSPRLVPCDQQDGLAIRIEGEQDPDLGAARRSGTKLLQVVQRRALPPVARRPTERGTDLGQQVDGRRHEFLRVPIELEEPLLH